MKTRVFMISAAVALLALPGMALGQLWSENFDGYGVGPLVPQGGWQYWDCVTNTDAIVTNAIARSAPNSAEITPSTDVVQAFAGVASGQWVISGYNYIPAGSFGEQYFILLNRWDCQGNWDWSLDILFDASAGLVSTVEGAGTAPLVYGEWVEVRVEIDLDTGTQTIYYNGAVLDVIAWAGTGLAALDLFSNGGSSIYWDDLVLEEEAPPVAVESSTWGKIKATYK
jgi:hypothetical protein